MATAAAILLIVYFIGLLIGIFVPPKQRDPQYGMAIGCAWMVELAVVALGIVLALAVAFNVAFLVKFVFVVVAFPAAIATPFLLQLGAKELRRRYLARQFWVRPEQIADTLRGQTHVIGQPVGEPFRPYREHRHYAPDGRLLLFREELAQISPAPGGDGTWSVDGQYLAVTIPTDPNPTRRYVLFRSRAGEISYFNHEPGAATDRQLALRTVEVSPVQPTPTPVVQDHPPQESP